MLFLLVCLLVLWGIGWCLLHPFVTGKAVGAFCGYIFVGIATICILGWLIFLAVG